MIVLLYSWLREVGARCWDEESCEPDGASIVSCSWWMRDGRLPLKSSRKGPNRQVQERVWRCWVVQSGSEEKVFGCLSGLDRNGQQRSFVSSVTPRSIL